MIIPDQDKLVSPATVRYVGETLLHGDTLPVEKQTALLPRLGYWHHWPDEIPDSEIRAQIEEGLRLPDAWDRFDEMPDYRWLFGHHNILMKHPAWHSEKKADRAALVALNPHIMPPCQYSNERADIEFIGLGGCDGIGASCYAYRRGSDVLLVDMGIHPDTDRLPDLDLLPPDWASRLRGIVLTHLHADHANGLLHYEPGFRRIGRLHLSDDLPVYCTDTTAALFPDVMRINAGNASRVSGIGRTVEALSRRLHPLAAHKWYDLGDVSIRLIKYPHVPGSALLEIGTPGNTVLHAVDFAADRSLGGHPFDWSHIPGEGIRAVVLESTYGRIDPEEHWRQIRAPRIFITLTEILRERLDDRRCRVLFPAFSLGRAQEIADLLERQVPDTTIMDGAAAGLSDVINRIAPDWKRYPIRQTDYLGYRNIVAGHGWMYEGTSSHNWYERLMHDDLVVFTGFIKPGTPAHRIHQAPSLHAKPRIIALPLSAHASLSQLLALVTASGAGRIVLVHGAPPAPRSELSIDDMLRRRGYETYRPRPGELLSL